MEPINHCIQIPDEQLSQDQNLTDVTPSNKQLLPFMQRKWLGKIRQQPHFFLDFLKKCGVQENNFHQSLHPPNLLLFQFTLIYFRSYVLIFINIQEQFYYSQYMRKFQIRESLNKFDIVRNELNLINSNPLKRSVKLAAKRLPQGFFSGASQNDKVSLTSNLKRTIDLSTSQNTTRKLTSQSRSHSEPHMNIQINININEERIGIKKYSSMYYKENSQSDYQYWNPSVSGRGTAQPPSTANTTTKAHSQRDQNINQNDDQLQLIKSVIKSTKNMRKICMKQSMQMASININQRQEEKEEEKFFLPKIVN